MEENMKDCPHCREKILNNSKFCSSCGTNLSNNQKSATQDEKIQASESLLSKLNKAAGGSGKIKLKLRDLIINVFRRHTPEERENTFICGTVKTSPKESEICSKWPKPWLYSRVFFLFALTFLVLVTLLRVFENVLAYPGIIFIGALIVPFSLLIFFWEVNAPRNINIFDVVKIFFIGGVFSLLLTMILSNMVYVKEVNYFGAVIIGITEEFAKFVVVAYFLKGSKEKYILNGLLLGAAVGAGFAVFETAGYAFAYGFQIPIMMRIIYTRGVLAFGGHIVWAAMYGAALVMVKKADNLRVSHIMNFTFIKYFIFAVMLHAIWDMPISNNSELPLVQIILTVMAWVIILILISAGLKQISILNIQEN